ncbi:MAG TPA: hypothetical protein VGI98_01020 [Candidatus Limnocylindrales bacterium]|jgi:hypothetical protein
MRRRKVVYPPAKTATNSRSAATGTARPGYASGAVTINLEALTGRADIRPGAHVSISSGMYEGQGGVVESLVGGVIPVAIVKTDSGQVRRVRTVDLRPQAPSAPSPAPTHAPDAEPAANEGEAPA